MKLGITNAGFRRLGQEEGPWRNLDEDIADALQHMMVTFNLDYGVLDQGMFNIERVESFDYLPLMEGYGGDEDAWVFGELAESGYSDEEIEKELADFRGEEWAWRVDYLEQGFPAIVVINGFPLEAIKGLAEDIEEREYAVGWQEIADGRGRCVFAYSMGMGTLPAAVLIPKNPYTGDDLE